MWQRIGRVAIVLWIVALGVIYTSLWIKTIRDPEEPKAADFIAFYAAARVAQADGYPEIYEISLQQNIENRLKGQTTDNFLLYNHLPYFVPILTLIVDQNYPASFLRWVLILLFIFLISILVLLLSLRQNEPGAIQLMLAGGMLTFMPLFISLWQGQDTAFVFFGLVLWCVGMLKRNEWLAAGGLALVTVRPHLCIVLALPLVFRYRRVFWRFIVLGFAASIYSLLLVGIKGIIGFLTLLNISAKGEWFGMNPGDMPNLTGMVYRLLLHFLAPNLINLFGWIIFATGILIVVLLWTSSKTIHEPLLGLTILIAAMFAPHLHLHDLAILALPLLFVIRNQQAMGMSLQNIGILPAASVVFLSGRMVGALEFIAPYIVAALLAWQLVIQYKQRELRT